MNNKFIYISIGILVFLKIFIALFFFNFSIINPDEESNYGVALHYMQTGDYLMQAYYGSGSVFLYEFVIYCGITKTTFILFYFIICQALYGLSIFWFYKLANVYLNNKQSLIVSYIYGLYPSVFFYIGAMFYYENFTTYLLIFNIYVLVRFFNNEKTGIPTMLLFSVFATVSCLLRGQLLAIYAWIFFILVLIVSIQALRHKKRIQSYRFFTMVFLTLLFICISYYPILLKNEKIFHVKIISTQFGYELLQGHNPYARGSWMLYANIKGNNLYEYIHTNIPNIDSLNQYEGSVKRKELAIAWIKNNPIDECVLTMRKTAIYFLPINYEVLPYSNFINPINLFVHLLFLLFAIQLIWIRKLIDTKLLILFLPISASFILSIVFFTGSRWRLYADPFLILLAAIYFYKIISHYNKKQA
jgi:hypothetical protein